jgi:hypothetical protein
VGEALLLLRLAEDVADAAEVRRLLGLAHLACGDVGAAVEDLTLANEARPDDAGIRAALATALGGPGRRVPAESRDDEPAETGTAAARSDVPRPADRASGPDVPRAADSPAPVAFAHPAPAHADEDRLRELARAASATPAPQPLLERLATAIGRRALPWAAAFFLVGAGGFTALATLRLRSRPPAAEGVVDARDPDGGRTPGRGSAGGRRGEAGPQRGDAGPGRRIAGPADGDARPAGEDARAERRRVAAEPREGGGDPALPAAADGAARDRGADAARERSAGPALSPASPPAGPGGVAEAGGGASSNASPDVAALAEGGAPEPPGDAPVYAFADRLGLPAPPGGVLDSANSELLRAFADPAAADRRKPLVLTYRTPAGPEAVAEFYVRAAGLRIRLREVAMGGPFQGVIRTVGRATAPLPDGRRATVTVSRPGVDAAARSLVAETTVRVDIR